ncbi:MAG: hypothetical protein ACLRMZ_18765 [Blautia marasmi]
MKHGIYTVEDREVSVEQMCDRALLAAHSIKGQYGSTSPFMTISQGTLPQAGHYGRYGNSTGYGTV